MKKTFRRHETNAWTHYWSKMTASSGRCLPDLPTIVVASLEKIWKDFFDSQPSGVRLLDLGTGNGTVLKLAKAQRPDLVLTGIDYAGTLPDLGCDITLHAGTTIEELPFADASFDVITSQFAIEYANISAAVKEVHRVLTDSASYLFICHHADGAVVRDNLLRLGPLRGLLSHAGLVDTAIKAVRQRKKSEQKNRQRLACLFEITQRKYPGQSVVHEVASDIARIMTEPNSLRKLLDLRRDLEMEGERIRALREAALTENQARGLTGMLSLAKHVVHLDMLYVPETNEPFAWKIISQPCI